MVTMATSFSCCYRQYLHLWVDHSIPRNQIAYRYRSHKASYSNLRPKIGCRGNVPQHLWTPI